MHILRQVLILRAMGFIHQDKDVAAFRENGIFLILIVLELMDQRKQHGLVAHQVFTQLC